VSYLYERAHKRELRTESAKKGTAIAVSQQDDLERGLLFNLRSAFVQTLQAKAVLQVSKDNLEYYDRVLKISSDRYQAGTSRRSISIDWSCRGCSTNPTFRRRS